ncbi:MAG: glutathione S-transferase family protein [Methylovulum sp.]|nr:glutathione S-transferase family protein [Methylovulum sp.]
MAITFYYASGSPFAWKVWLALEHKQLPYELKLMSLQNGELKKTDFLAINPRGKIPVLVEDGTAIRESAVIVEYLEERYPDRPLFPGNAQDRATVRRVIAEVNNYLYPVARRLLEQTLFRSDDSGDPAVIAQVLTELQQELSYFEDTLLGDYFADELSAADFTFYPMLALLKRLHDKQPQYGADCLIRAKLTAFMQRIEQLPYFELTTPPHWKA